MNSFLCPNWTYAKVVIFQDTSVFYFDCTNIEKNECKNMLFFILFNLEDFFFGGGEYYKGKKIEKHWPKQYKRKNKITQK